MSYININETIRCQIGFVCLGSHITDTMKQQTGFSSDFDNHGGHDSLHNVSKYIIK